MPANPTRMLRLTDVQRLCPYTRVHLHRLERQGRFPKRIHLGKNRVVWDEGEILAWLEARKAERDAA